MRTGLDAFPKRQCVALARGIVLAAVLLHGCLPLAPREWKNWDALRDPPPRPTPAIRGSKLDNDEYRTFIRWGADWFRSETFGNERSVTDVAGVLNGVVEVPCTPAKPDCYEKKSVLAYLAQAIDALDGVPNNLFTGNGGPDGLGFTSDLVITFPPGTRLFGTIPVPSRLHTGLDVEAGEPWPLGMVAIPAPAEDQQLRYLPNPSELGAGPAPGMGRVRLGLTCALCHYSLDIDWDGHADLKSARLDRPTRGSPYRPEHAWAMGNQDLHFGWLFSLSANPLLGLTVLSAPVGRNGPEDAVRLVQWVTDNYLQAPEAVKRQVAIGMLLQPRGYADDTPDARHDPVQIPTLLPEQAWPYNFDGALVNASDRNNSVWTAALDFTGLIGLCRERAGAGRKSLYWESDSVYYHLPCERFANLITQYAPAVVDDPSRQRSLADDILGISDGIPGMLRQDSVIVMDNGSGVMPKEIFDNPVNRGRQRTASFYGEDAAQRGPGVMALLGLRVITPPKVAQHIGLDEIIRKHPTILKEEFVTDAVSLALNWSPPAPNLSPLLTGQWDRIARGYDVFRQMGCAGCHRGPFFTDNVVHRLYEDAGQEIGIAAPSTAGWRFPGRDAGPALRTQAERALGSRPQQLFVAPDYDPMTGKAARAGGLLLGLFGDKHVGYKTVTLRNVWASAPYLHDGGVGVGFLPGVRPPRDLVSLLRKAAGPDVYYGMGAILDIRETEQEHDVFIRPDAALSLQALFLKSERQHVVMENRRRTFHVLPGGSMGEKAGAPPDEMVSMASLGVAGVGHDFYVDDVPGGERISALVAFLLALDDRPCELPEERSDHCASAK